MKILIITHYYKHKNAMASIRPIKLAKYFAKAGHEVTVLASLQRDNWCRQELNPTPVSDIKEIYAQEHHGMQYLRLLYNYMERRGQKKKIKAQQTGYYEKSITEPNKKKGSKKQRIKLCLSWFYYYSCDRFENWCLYKGLVNALKKNDLKDFDVVIATYPGAGVHKAGEWVKKHQKAQYFVADYRDPAYNPGGRTNKIEIRHDKKIQDNAIYLSDAIVCVSQGMADSLKMQYKDKKIAPIYVVRNGFDPADIDPYIESHIDSQYFNFVYTGALYNGRRSIDLLARVLHELIDEKVISTNKIRLHYAGPNFEEMLNQLEPYNLENIAIDHGYVSRQESLAMQCNSDVVLLLNWNQENYTGVIPGKLYEYMSAKRPICALIMGDRGGSETANMIRQDRLGCACEQAVAKDIVDLKIYIKQMFEDFSHGVRRKLESKAINKYNYEQIAQEYLGVLKQCKERN